MGYMVQILIVCLINAPGMPLTWGRGRRQWRGSHRRAGDKQLSHGLLIIKTFIQNSRGAGSAHIFIFTREGQTGAVFSFWKTLETVIVLGPCSVHLSKPKPFSQACRIHVLSSFVLYFHVLERYEPAISNQQPPSSMSNSLSQSTPMLLLPHPFSLNSFVPSLPQELHCAPISTCQYSFRKTLLPLYNVCICLP